MDDFKNSLFYKEEVKKYLAKYGDVPPPWIFAPNSHPYHIQWRMGAGESHIMILSTWYEENFSTEKEKIDYFRKYPAPPRWLACLADWVWDLEVMEEDFDYSPYFNKLKEYGFEGTDKYLEDLSDEKWLNQ